MSKYKSLLHVADLKRGDIVRNIAGRGDSYVVTDSKGSLATAVRSIEISNAAEWEVLLPEQLKIERVQLESLRDLLSWAQQEAERTGKGEYFVGGFAGRQVRALLSALQEHFGDT